MNRYLRIPTTTINNKRCYVTVRYPEIPLSINDMYVYTTQGDRFDILAAQYYNDQSLWWIISIANTAIAGTSLPSDLSQDSLIIPEGIQIRIPSDYPGILSNFELINNTII